MRRRPALRALAGAAVVAGFVAPLVRRRLDLPAPVVSAIGWQAPFALVAAAPRTRGRDAGIFFMQMWAYVAHYQMPNDHPDRLLERLKVTYPRCADRAIGFGELPTHRLQRALGREGEVRAHDWAFAVVHWAWFLFPHGSLIWILWRHPRLFPRSACLMAGTFDLGLLGYWAVPTAPPWWASQVGEIEPVRRIMFEAGERFWGRLWRPLYDFIGGNPFAAMPSLHFGTSVMAAHVLSDAGRLPGALGWAYTAALGFALVYMGEHYVIDLAAGLALAEAVRRMGPAAGPLLQATGRLVGRLDPGTP